jgi:chemotaxis protein CheZ
MRMVEIWGGIESLMRLESAPEMPTGDHALLNGPALAGEEGRATQDDIDALFA